MPFLSRPVLVDTQGALHRYCAAVDEDEVRFDGQSQKASDSPPHRPPDNETDCGWAPFGELSACRGHAATEAGGPCRVLPRATRARSLLAVTVPRR